MHMIKNNNMVKESPNKALSNDIIKLPNALFVSLCYG